MKPKRGWSTTKGPKTYLKGVARANRRDGGYYWYAWRGGPRLRGEPDSAEFVESYHEAIKNRPPEKPRRDAGGVLPGINKTSPGLGSWSSESFCLHCGTVLIREGRVRGGKRYCDEQCAREARKRREQRVLHTDECPTEILGYEGLKRLAWELGRPAKTLCVLNDRNDPFYIRPGRVRNAEWFADARRHFSLGQQKHVHGMHYALVVRPRGEVVLPNGDAYENTEEHDEFLGRAARDARYLGLIPAESIADHRNMQVEINHRDDEEPAAGGVTQSDAQAFSVPGVDLAFPEPPRLTISKPVIPQRYMVEVWIEKSTMDDIIGPLGREYGVNIFPGLGQSSETRCRELVDRARASAVPIRILYVSDFDPAGDSMPVAAARKIEFWIRKLAPDLDIQVRHIMLTQEQCRRYALPGKPLKKGDPQIPIWRDRFGQGATELDALEALHPGVFRSILVNEIERYIDGSLQTRIDEVHANTTAELENVNGEVLAQHEADIEALRGEHEKLVERVNARRQEVEEEFQEAFGNLAERAKGQWQAITEMLDERSPDFDAVEWPEPAEGNEDDDPLFDSSRDFLTQADRFKQHQDKPITRAKYGTGRTARKARKRRERFSPPEEEL
jgi:hypothetical protein